MKNVRWLAAFTAIVAVFLFINGGFAIMTIDAIRTLEPDASTPFATPQDIAWAKSLLPSLYLFAVEGIVFGSTALITAAGLLKHQSWAHRALLFSSVALAIVAVVGIVMAPQTWDIQGVFILFCVLLWWEAKKWR